MRITCLTRYDALGASSRMRFMQYLKPVQSHLAGSTWTVQHLLDEDYLLRKYARQSVLAATVRCFARRALSAALRKTPDLWWVEKEMWPFVPALAERGLLRRAPYVLDLDDAIFHNYDRHRLPVVRRLYGRKIDRLMAGAALVTAGNDYLAQRARDAGARWVEVLPTVVDLVRYPETAGETAEDVLRIGWIGSPATVGYLRQIAEPLRLLSLKHRVRLTVVGGGAIDLPGVEVEVRPWSEASEVADIRRFDIGVMPLTDSHWERGKCGYKLIQYMACSVPVVASAVGVNQRIVTDDFNGFLATDDAGWFQALDRLATDRAMRARLGAAGRARVASNYCVQVTAPLLANWMQALVPGVR
jgi:glycosyltransferase involved in cell wall biosynthesis